MRRPAQALVEFALAVAFVFVPLVLGTFDMARACFAYAVMANVVREAGRYAATTPGYTPASVRAAVLGSAVGLDTSPATLTLNVSDATSGMPGYIRVTGTYEFVILTPGVARFAGDPGDNYRIAIKVDTSAPVG